MENAIGIDLAEIRVRTMVGATGIAPVTPSLQRAAAFVAALLTALMSAFGGKADMNCCGAYVG